MSSPNFDPAQSRRLIVAVGPLLRGLLSTGPMLKLVEFRESAADKSKATVGVKLMPDAAPETILQRLRQAIEEHQRTNRSLPAQVYVAGLGYFTATDPASTNGRAAGKVTIVTGAAQGFGLEIAQDLATQGAYVVLADMNAQGAQMAAAAIEREHGLGRSLGLPVNVTDANSLEEMIHQVVRKFGGFDLFVSNAGVLKAGSVKTQPEKDFDFVTAVNYKGFFLCVQKAAPIMALQHQGCPGCWSDIIQINSKSGLQGSNKNGAYAGSKFGGIGLTQSFAMELVEDGIKVNAICPGNYFDGPLWSDPDSGLFVQYLRSGKVPGAKTIADVKKFYEAKVPMNRGCTTPDVMKAVYYLMEQNYETGQALPVTGGQVMLS